MGHAHDKSKAAAPAGTPTAAGPAPAGKADGTRTQLKSTNYANGAALVAPDNAPGYHGAKTGASPAAKAGANRYAMTGGVSSGDGKYANWHGKGVGIGTTEKDQAGEGGKGPKNAKIGAPKVADVGPSKEILAHGHKKDLGGGKYAQTWAGTSSEHEQKPVVGIERDGKKKVEVASGNKTASVGARLGIAGKAETEGRYGSASAKGDAALVAQAGARAKYGVSSEGGEASADASAKAGAEVSGSAEAKTREFLGGTAGVEAKGKAFAGARVGAGGKAAITKEFIGLQGQAGGFAGVEASGEVAAHVGPVGCKGTASAQAGVGASIAGEVSYHHGKLVFSARAAVALGLGASVGASVEIDVATAIKMGGEVAKIAYRFADQDGDGKLTLNDAASGAGKGVKGGAKAVDRGVDKTLAALDADGDGHFGKGDLAAHAKNAGHAVASGAHAVGQAGHKVLKAGKNALDRDGDGKLDLADVKAGAQQAKGKLVAVEHKVADKARGAAKWAGEKGTQLKDAAAKGVHQAGELATGAGHALHKAADADGDGKLGLHDVAVHASHAKDAVVGGAKSAGHAVAAGGKWAGHKVAAGAAKVADGATKAAHAVHDAADVNHDGKVDAADAKVAAHGAVTAIQQKARHAKERIVHGLDVNHDGKVDAADASAAAHGAKQKVVATYHAAVDKAHDVADKTVHAAKTTVAKAKHAADLDGDGKLGLGDVKAGAKAAYAGAKAGAGVVAKKAGAVWNGAKAQASQAKATFGAAVDEAGATLKGSWAKCKHFFGGKPKDRKAA